MVGVGMLMALVGAFCLFMIVKKKPIENWKFAKFLPFALFLPYLANSTGWILTEVGRQPWLVFGLLKTEDAVSPNLTTGMVFTSLIGFTLIYGLLMAADAYLLVKYAKAGPAKDDGAVDQLPAQDAAYLG